MQIKSRRELIPVPKGNLLTLSQGGPVEIGCESGTVWITQDNDVRDVVLNAGEQFVSDRPGTVLVYALQMAVLTATASESPKRTSLWQQIVARMRSGERDRGFATA
ncbi:MAG: DUF2917 domain-containing protein [Burkholderiaceae bacterium]